MEQKDNSFDIKVLKIYKTELKRIRTRVEKNRITELAEMVELDNELDNLTYEELQDMYGWDEITMEEFDLRVKRLEDYKKRKQVQQTTPTTITHLLQMINNDIHHIEDEITTLEYEMLSDDEKAKKDKLQREYEKRREQRQKEREGR